MSGYGFGCFRETTVRDTCSIFDTASLHDDMPTSVAAARVVHGLLFERYPASLRFVLTPPPPVSGTYRSYK